VWIKLKQNNKRIKLLAHWLKLNIYIEQVLKLYLIQKVNLFYEDENRSLNEEYIWMKIFLSDYK
jgi:hypothetical protein